VIYLINFCANDRICRGCHFIVVGVTIIICILVAYTFSWVIYYHLSFKLLIVVVGVVSVSVLVSVLNFPRSSSHSLSTFNLYYYYLLSFIFTTFVRHNLFLYLPLYVYYTYIHVVDLLNNILQLFSKWITLTVFSILRFTYVCDT